MTEILEPFEDFAQRLISPIMPNGERHSPELIDTTKGITFTSNEPDKEDKKIEPFEDQ